MRTVRTFGSIGLATFALAAGVAHASGGGGGGGGGGMQMPSVSAPQYDPAEEYRTGVDALNARDFKKALSAFHHVLEATPGDANTNYLAGLAAAGLADTKHAIKYLEKAVKLDDRLIDAHAQLAIVRSKTGDAAGARAERTNLADKLTACGDTCPDAAALKAAIAKADAALAVGTQAKVDPAPSLKFSSAAAGDRAYWDAVSLVNAHRYQEAIAFLQDARTSFGAHPDILTYLGFANRKLGHYAKAEAYYRAALAIAPTHRGALEYYGELKVERGDIAGARSNLALLDKSCTFGCYEAEELRRWIAIRRDPQG